jgi:hypothetical protein
MNSICVLSAFRASGCVVRAWNAAKCVRNARNQGAPKKKTAARDNHRLQVKSITLAASLIIMLGIAIVIPEDLSAQQALADPPQVNPQLGSSSLVEISGLSSVIPISPTFSSSSEPDSTDPASDSASTTSALLGDRIQPPPRRTYNRPTYSDNSHNSDGSNKYTFLIGGGFTLPTGNTRSYLTTNFNLQGGAGRNFSRNFGIIAQFDFADFGFQNSTLNTLLATYNSIGATDQNGNPLSQLGGSSHVWSLTLNPIYYVSQSDKSGIYVVGGLGFYHKTANFTIPSVGTYCDPYYGCYQDQANQTIDKYTSNAFGVNGGIGFAHRLSLFASARLFVEARYVFVDNQPRPYSLGSTASSYFNVFPQNSEQTTFIPVTVGIRF